MKYLLPLSLLIFNSQANVEHRFEPRVIIKKPAIEQQITILADNLHFVTTYQKESNSFNTIVIPFSVISNNENEFSYQFALGEFTNQCLLDGNSSASNWEGIKLVLDDNNFTSTSNPYKKSENKTHHLQIVFPEIAQQNESQYCNGQINLIAQVVL